MPQAGSLGTSSPVSELVNVDLWKTRILPSSLLVSSSDAVRACGGAEVADRAIKLIPDETIRFWLQSATSDLELRLGRPLSTVRCKCRPFDEGDQLGRDYDLVVQPLPYNHRDTQQWIRIDLPGGVISVERVRGYFFEQPVWEWSADKENEEMITLEWGKQGIVHIIPKEMQTALIGQGSRYALFDLLAGNKTPVPKFWRVDYTLGPVAEWGGPGQIEKVFVEWVYLTAGIRVLSTAGAVQSGGVASTSISMDGISESVSTTASAIYGLYSALENAMKERLKDIKVERLIKIKRGVRVRHLGR